MARARKKTVEPVVVKKGVQVAEVVVPVTVEAEAAAPPEPKKKRTAAKTVAPKAAPAAEREEPKPAPRRPSRSRRTAEPAPAPVPVPIPVPVPAPAAVQPTEELDALRKQLDEATRRLEEFGKQASPAASEAAAVRKQITEAGRQLEQLGKQVAPAASEAAALRESLVEAARGAEAFAKQAAQAREQLEALRQLREQVGQDIQEFRREASAAREDHRAVSAGAAEAVAELRGSVAKVEEVARLFGEAGQRLLQELKGQLAPVRQSLAESGPHLEALPQRAAEAVGRLEQATRELAESSRRIGELRRQADEAEVRLDAIRHQVSAEEVRLASLAQQIREREGRLAVVEQQAREAEGRLENARAQVSRPERQAAETGDSNGAAEDEARQSLGLTVGRGVIVSEVVPGSPAESAGVAAGDVLAAVNGAPVQSGPEVRALVQDAVGDAVSLMVVRAGRAMEMMTPLGPATEEDAEEGRNRLGLVVGGGVVIDEVHEGTPAESAGLMPGDVILMVNGTPVQTGTQVRQLVQMFGGVGEVALAVSRAGETREVRIFLDQPAEMAGAAG